MLSEAPNGGSSRRRWIRPCLLALILAPVLTGTSSAIVMRVDGDFGDWKDVAACASDPKGDATGAFDITRVYAASPGTILFLRFDTVNVLNLQNGPESEGTLLILVDLPDNRRLTVNTRGRRAFLGNNSEERIPWDRLKYVVGPTYAQNEFELQIDLGQLDVDRGDTVSIHFDGSDQLSSPITFTLAQPWETPQRRSPHRRSGTDVRIVSLNTYREGLNDPNREDAIGRLLNSVDGDIYCFQEEWDTEGHGDILKRLMPTRNAKPWHIHKVHGNVIASQYPLKTLPSKNDQYAVARIQLADDYLFVINAHLRAMGYIDSREDRLRVQQANDIAATIAEIHGGQHGEEDRGHVKPAIVIVGDFNLVGSRTPLDKIIEKKSYGMKDWLAPNLIGESVVTWRGGSHASFSPGKLDYIVYSAHTLVPQNGFILDSELLNQTERRQLKLDRTDSTLSDHLPVTVDFQFSDSSRD